MRRINRAVDGLCPIAALEALGRSTLAGGQRRPLEVRRLGGKVARAHVDPHHAATHSGSVGYAFCLGLEQLAAFGLRGNVDAIALNIIFPAMVDASQPAFLIASIEQMRAAMRAVGFNDTDPPSSV